MKLVNINIGIKIDNTDKISDFLVAQKADIITLQEVLRHLDDSVFEQFKSQEGIKKTIGENYPYKFFGPLWVTHLHKTSEKIHRDFGGQVEQGNEILSKFPIVSATNEFFYKDFGYFLDVTNWRKEDHGRAITITELDVNGKRLQILNLHGIWTQDKLGDERTIEECKYVIEAAKRNDIPTIIVGDFNLLPESESITLLNGEFINLIDKYKITSTRPHVVDETDKGNVVVDYIFVNEKIKVNDFKVIDTDISDHLPLVLDFEI